MKKIFLLLVALLSFFGTDCKNDPISPDDIKPGRRDYVWTVDTLQLPFGDIFTPTRIWGSSPNDVWITGAGDAGDLLWHYDGIRWTRDSTKYLISPSALWGTASNNIWMGNTNSTIWHYDGVKWYKFSEHSFGDYQRISIENIFGKSTTSIYGVGFADRSLSGRNYRGIIMHYDGLLWQNVSIESTMVAFIDGKIQNNDGLIFLEGTEYSQTTGSISKIFVFDGISLKQIFTSFEYYGSINEINGEIYLIYNKQIYKYRDNKLILWRDLSNTTFTGKMWGRNEKDFFSFASDGIGHYNGSDFKSIFIIADDLKITNGFVFENEVFFSCFSITQNLNVVIHGKLATIQEK